MPDIMPQVKWGYYSLSPAAASEHFLFVGSTGSGKSVLIRMLMRSAFENNALRLGTRGVIYDAKGDILPFLYDVIPRGFNPVDYIQVLHPFDERGWAWDIAGDVTSLLAARQIASILIPEPPRADGAEEFFTEATRELLMGAMIALMNSRKKATWTLRDLLLLSLNAKDLSAALKSTGLHTTERIRTQYLEGADPRTRANIQTSLSTRIGVYEPVAAVWAKLGVERRLSIRQWIGSNKILVLGNDERARSSIDPINRALFQRITEETLNLPEQARSDVESGRSRTWIILDEFREAGKLEGLRRLLNKGRSKGACVVLGCQDVEGVRSVYGKEEGGELLAQCLHTVVLNLINPETAEWASNLFGAEDIAETASNTTVGGQYSEGESTSLRRKNLVNTRELLTMRRLSPQNGMSGYYKSPSVENSEALKTKSQYQRICPWLTPDDPRKFAWNTISPWLGAAPGVLSFEPRELSDQYLQPWKPEERTALGLALEEEEKAEKDAAPGKLQEEAAKAAAEADAKQQAAVEAQRVTALYNAFMAMVEQATLRAAQNEGVPSGAREFVGAPLRGSRKPANHGSGNLFASSTVRPISQAEFLSGEGPGSDGPGERTGADSDSASQGPSGKSPNAQSPNGEPLNGEQKTG